MEDNFTKFPAPQEDDSTKYPAGAFPAAPTIPAAPARKGRSWLTIVLMLLCLLFLAGLAYQTWRLTELEDGRATSANPEFTSIDAAISYITEQDIQIYELKETIKALEAENDALQAALAETNADLASQQAKIEELNALLSELQ